MYSMRIFRFSKFHSSHQIIDHYRFINNIRKPSENDVRILFIMEKLKKNDLKTFLFVKDTLQKNKNKSDQRILDMLLPPEYQEEDKVFYQSAKGSCSL